MKLTNKSKNSIIFLAFIIHLMTALTSVACSTLLTSNTNNGGDDIEQTPYHDSKEMMMHRAVNMARRVTKRKMMKNRVRESSVPIVRQEGGNLRRGLSTKAPSTTPTCSDSPLNFILKESSSPKDCTWVAQKPGRRCAQPGVGLICPSTCNKCSKVCMKESRLKFEFVNFDGERKKKTCAFVAKKSNLRCQYSGIKETCRVTCNSC